jgi:hypothetical protein
MAGTESKEREAVKRAYKGLDGKPAPKWAKQVAEMSDQQVIAVYMRLKKQNKI